MLADATFVPQISKEKESKTGAEARLKVDLEEREEELLKQVEETKRVEAALRSKEKELYALKVRSLLVLLHTSPRPLADPHAFVSSRNRKPSPLDQHLPVLRSPSPSSRRSPRFPKKQLPSRRRRLPSPRRSRNPNPSSSRRKMMTRKRQRTLQLRWRRSMLEGWTMTRRKRRR